MAREQTGTGRFNLLLGALIVVMLAFFLIIVSRLVVPIVSETLDLFTVVSTVFGLFLCLPLSIHLFRSTKTPGLTIIFKGLALDYAILFLAAMMWYAVPAVTDVSWAGDVGMIMMIISYLPILAVLGYLFATRVKREEENFIFILVTAGICIIFTLLFAGMDLYTTGGGTFSAIIYLVAVVIDIAALALSAMLAINYLHNQFRYIFSVLIVNFLLALAGDSLNLLFSLGLYSRAEEGVHFYDIMIIFMAISLLFFALNRVRVTTVEEVSRKLEDTKSLMQDLIMQSPDAICIFEVDGALVQANPAFLRLAGYDSCDGQASLNLFRDIDRLIKSPERAIDDVRAGRIVIYEGSTPRTPAGSPVQFYSVKIFPTVDEKGKITSYTMFAADITRQKAREAELETAKDEAELYLDLMGHDINNMHQIAMGYLEYARNTLTLDDGQKQYISRPFETLERSSRLIQNVLKLNKLKSGDIRLEPVDLRKVLADTVGEFQGTPGRSISLNVDGEARSLVMANKLLQDVFLNLIGNAFKHACKEHCEVAVKLDRVQENGCDCYRVTVEDNGQGIPDDHKEHIFNRMWRGNTQAEGTGLGLYLARALVESYHGRIWVENRVPGDHAKGARFVVLLPVAGDQ